MRKDLLKLWPRGHVIQKINGNIIREGDNLVVDSALEVMMQCLMVGASSALSAIIFGNTGSAVPGVAPLISPSMRTVATAGGGAVSPLNQLADTLSYTSADLTGLKSIGTFITIYKPTTSFTYDTLGLISYTGLLFAVTSFVPVTLPAHQAVSVQWQLQLAGGN